MVFVNVYSIEFSLDFNISAAGDFVKFGFPMAGMTTVVAWSIVDYPLGYSSAGKHSVSPHMLPMR